MPETSYKSMRERYDYKPIVNYDFVSQKAVHSLARIRSAYCHSVFRVCLVRHFLFIHMQPVTCPFVYDHKGYNLNNGRGTTKSVGIRSRYFCDPSYYTGI